MVKAAARGKYDGIQCLRFLAALMVVVTHSTFYASERLTPGSYVWGRGTMGVDIFFVISGFVMYASSIHLQGEADGWRDFSVKRLVRIVPLYWAVTSLKLAILLAAPAVVLHSQIDWSYIAKSYFFIPAYNVDGNVEPLLGVGWTLIFEMFFYAVFALALLLRVKVMPAVATVMTACAIGALFRTDDWPAWTVYFNMRVLEFLAGMIIARSFTKSVRPLWLGLATTALGFALIFFAPSAGPGLGQIITLVIPSTLVVFGVVSLEPHFSGRWPKAIVFLGAASYSLYLIHPIVAPSIPTLLAKIGLAIQPISVLGSIFAAIIAGVTIYGVGEAPLTKWLTGVTRKLKFTTKAAKMPGDGASA